MGRIYFRQYYTPLVEEYLRTVVRKRKLNFIPIKWRKFTTNWIEHLSDEDRNFIKFVFHADHYNSYVGVLSYCPQEQFLLKYRRLYDLERQFAIDAGLLTTGGRV